MASLPRLQGKQRMKTHIGWGAREMGKEMKSGYADQHPVLPIPTTKNNNQLALAFPLSTVFLHLNVFRDRKDTFAQETWRIPKSPK